MKNFCTILALFFISNFAQAQNQVYYVGHSLVGLDMPFQVRQIAKQKSVATNYRNHINIGTALKENWLDTAFNLNDVWDPVLMINYEHGSNHLVDLPTPFEHIVITESVPLMGNNRDTTVKYSNNFFQLAKTGKSTIRKYIYATWEHADAGWPAWRTSLTTLQSEWENIADRCSTLISDTVFIVPGNRAMMALYDTLQKGAIGDKTSIDQFFNDDIHLSFEGNYYMACLTAAVVYHIDPRSTAMIGAGPYTHDTVVRNNSVRWALQELAWQTACKYERSGLKCSVTTSINKAQNISIAIYPNPATKGSFTIIANTENKFQFYDLTGKLLLDGYIKIGENTIDCSAFDKGIYLLKTNNQTYKLVLQ